MILPYVGRIPIETYRKLEEFVRGGGILIATRRTPLEQPGFLATQENHNQIIEISKRLFEGTNPSAHLVMDEKSELRTTLNRLLPPDVGLSPAAPDVGFIHRRTTDGEIYFIANTSNTAQHLQATFRLNGVKPEWWNPFDGSVTPATVTGQASGATVVALDLEPYGSRVLIFSKRTLSPVAANRPAQETPIDLSTGWRVSFGSEGNPTQMPKLSSWTDNESTRYFSGVATYEKDVDIPETMTRNGQPVKLDFGEGTALPAQNLRAGMQAWYEGPIREAAVVFVNDKRAGSLWCPPYSLDVTGLLRSGKNTIRVMVANTAMNYMAGHSLPDYRLLNLRYGERFQAQDMDRIKALPSGLLGPIRLIGGER